MGRNTNRFTETKPSLLLENPYSLPVSWPKTCSNVIFVRSRAFISPLRREGVLKIVENALRWNVHCGLAVNFPSSVKDIYCQWCKLQCRFCSELHMFKVITDPEGSTNFFKCGKSGPWATNCSERRIFRALFTVELRSLPGTSLPRCCRIWQETLFPFSSKLAKKTICELDLALHPPPTHRQKLPQSHWSRHTCLERAPHRGGICLLQGPDYRPWRPTSLEMSFHHIQNIFHLLKEDPQIVRQGKAGKVGRVRRSETGRVYQVRVTKVWRS